MKMLNQKLLTCDSCANVLTNLPEFIAEITHGYWVTKCEALLCWYCGPLSILTGDDITIMPYKVQDCFACKEEVVSTDHFKKVEI